MALGLFDLTKMIFEDPVGYEEVTPGEKRKHFFMVNRRFAINFPMQANVLQHLKVNQAAVVDFWQTFMRKMYKRTPGWMYVKGVKKAAKEKEAKAKVSGKVIDEYVKFMKVDKKSVLDALEFYPERMTKELKDFEKMIGQK